VVKHESQLAELKNFLTEWEHSVPYGNTVGVPISLPLPIKLVNNKSKQISEASQTVNQSM
jgi:hypothetical protein